MWKELPAEDKREYKRMILAFASLTEMFAQKTDEQHELVPVLNSKYQEKVFHKTFGACVEDIGNTSYDASISSTGKKFLIGLKTFGLKSGDQKIAQFKANHDEWTEDFDLIKKNCINDDGSTKTKEEIDEVNKEIYLKIARRIARLRNMRINSSKKNLQGFIISEYDDEAIESVYHVLMPASEDGTPFIAVGEISYDYIDVDNIEIKGCTSPKTPTNFTFTDKNHEYRFTSADSQLLMNFSNKNIVIERWSVKYADDAYEIFAGIADKLYQKDPSIKESHSWMIPNKEGVVELFSGFNGFYGVGSKLSRDSRKEKIDEFEKIFSPTVEDNIVCFTEGLETFLLEPSPKMEDKLKKVKLRNELMEEAENVGNEGLKISLEKLLYRPAEELYIPIPNSRRFHSEHPDFFVRGGIKFDGSKLVQSTAERQFKMVFEPSHNEIEVYIAEDYGKAIESTKSMKVLGRWILREVFQLLPYEPLTTEKLNEIGINGIRLIKYDDSDDIHLHFIWIDKENLPEDYWE